MVRRFLTVLASPKFRGGVVALAVLIGAISYLRSPLFYQKFSDGVSVARGWKGHVVRGKPIAYSLISPTGKEFPLEKLTFDSLEFTILERGLQSYVLTRYPGEGSSGAYYYAVIHLTDEKPAFLGASVVRDWKELENGECAVEPFVEAPPANPSTIFADCSGPTVSLESILFRQPGWHCSPWQTGGCPLETVVKLAP